MLSGIVIIRRSSIPLLEDDNLTKGWAKREKGTTIVDSSAMRSPPNNPIRIISAICSRGRLARLSAA